MDGENRLRKCGNMGLEKPVISSSIGGNKVKHIQRGYIDGTSTTDGLIKIPLNGFTNLDKMVAFVDGVFHNNNSNNHAAVAVASLSLAELAVSGYYSSATAEFSYQVIEFD